MIGISQMFTLLALCLTTTAAICQKHNKSFYFTTDITERINARAKKTFKKQTT